MPRGSYLLRSEEGNDARYDVLCFNANACDLAGVAADITVYYVPAEMQVVGWYVQVELTIVATVTDPAVSIDYADFDGAANRVEIANLTIPNTTVAGTEYYMPFTGPTVLAVGQTLILEHKTQAAGVAPAGVAHVQAYVRWTGRR